MHLPQSRQTIPFHACNDVSINEPLREFVGGAGFKGIGGLMYSGHSFRSLMNAGFQARVPWRMSSLVENFVHVSLRHVHPASKTCLLETPQAWQVSRGAFLTKSGVVVGCGDPFTPHQLHFEPGSAYYLALHRLRPHIRYMIETQYVVPVWYLDGAMQVLCTCYTVSAVASKGC